MRKYFTFFCRNFSATDCIDFIINSLNPIDRFGLKKASPALYALDLPKMLELFFKLGIRFYRISAPITLYLRSPQMMWISPFSITLRARGARVLMSVTPVWILPSLM